MPAEPTFFKRTIPFVISLIVHLGLLAALYSPNAARSPGVTIEVQWRKPRGQTANLTGHTMKNVPPKPEAALAPQPQLPVGDESGSPDGPGNIGDGTSDDSTVLGSSLGVNAHYPRLSRLLGEAGTVVVLINNPIGDSIGVPLDDQNVRVSVTSGFARLDESAVQATRDAIQSGALTKTLANKSELRIRYIFKLLSSEPKPP